jgi:NADPH:quinone reductase-like Zn-dependent oxidoreductase
VTAISVLPQSYLFERFVVAWNSSQKHQRRLVNPSSSSMDLVDERIVGRKPKTLDFTQSAALPLTTLTAWELLFERRQIPRDGGDGSILVTGAAGGVG